MNVTYLSSPLSWSGLIVSYLNKEVVLREEAKVEKLALCNLLYKHVRGQENYGETVLPALHTTDFIILRIDISAQFLKIYLTVAFSVFRVVNQSADIENLIMFMSSGCFQDVCNAN
jgi:hypothetical protein